mmetsp:Transcript_82867/g.238117  ORF Transcript_82867/g.238117 Transcript_82867/m.238117 type:complete len:81 (+) Transcript_82867:946-1188(+)
MLPSLLGDRKEVDIRLPVLFIDSPEEPRLKLGPDSDCGGDAATAAASKASGGSGSPDKARFSPSTKTSQRRFSQEAPKVP